MLLEKNATNAISYKCHLLEVGVNPVELGRRGGSPADSNVFLIDPAPFLIALSEYFVVS